MNLVHKQTNKQTNKQTTNHTTKMSNSSMRGNGKRCAEFACTDYYVLQSLGVIARAIKLSNAFVDNKALLTETILANIVANLRKHYEASIIV
jgi:hypothetical protein